MINNIRDFIFACRPESVACGWKVSEIYGRKAKTKTSRMACVTVCARVCVSSITTCAQACVYSVGVGSLQFFSSLSRGHIIPLALYWVTSPNGAMCRPNYHSNGMLPQYISLSEEPGFEKNDSLRSWEMHSNAKDISSDATSFIKQNLLTNIPDKKKTLDYALENGQE